jgi:NADH dehydrogenase FAD-containing subunit
MAALLPEGSSKGNEFVETFTTVMGSPVIYLAGSTAVGGDAEQVAEILSSYVNMAVRQSSRIAQELVRALEKSAKEQEPAPPSGTGRLGGVLLLPSGCRF